MRLPGPTICARCGGPHAQRGSVGAEDWRQAEEARDAWAAQGGYLPPEALAPLRAGQDAYVVNVYRNHPSGTPRRNRDQVLCFGAWAEYFGYLQWQAQQHVGTAKVAVTNYSVGPRRRDHNQVWADRIYFDCDAAGSLHPLAHALAHYRIPAIFHESSGSVRRRAERGDVANQLEPDSWHVEIPLARRLYNPWATEDRDPPADPNWRYWLGEAKRAYRHAAGVMSALAQFGGVGGRCGFDLATSALCQLRYLGARPGPDSPVVPRLFMAPGDCALDLEWLLACTGYQPAPRPEAVQEQVQVVEVTRPDGTVAERQVVSHDRQLFADVKAAIGVRAFLESHLFRSPTRDTGSGGAYYYCPIHGEERNPSGLSSGPNQQGFHVFRSSQGEERWRCHGDCATGGDVIHLAARVWDLRNGEAARRLAERLGLDLTQYMAEVVDPDEELLAVVPETDADADDDDDDDEAAEATADLPAMPAQPTLAELAGPQPKPKKRPRKRKRTRYAPLEHVADWIDEWLPRRGYSPRDAVRAIACFLLKGQARYQERAGGGGKAEIVSFDCEQDPERVAATIYSVLHRAIKLNKVRGEVFAVRAGLDRGRSTKNRTWICEQLGWEALNDLAYALYLDDRAAKNRTQRPEYKEYVRRAIAFEGFSDRERLELHAALIYHSREYVPRQCDEHATEEEQEATRRANARYDGVQRALQRPKACRRFRQEVWAEDRLKLGEHCILCESKTCGFCVTRRVMVEWDILRAKWTSRARGGPVYFARIECDTFEQLATVKEEVRRVGRPRIYVQGIRPGGRPVALYGALTPVDHGYISGVLRACANRFWRLHGFAGGRVVWTEHDVERALATAMHEHLTGFAYAREQIRTGRGVALIEYLSATYRKQLVVARSDEGLPWVTQDDIRTNEPAREESYEDQLEPGERLIYRLYHRETGVLLGRKAQPYTVDQAAAVAAHNTEIRNRMQQQRALARAG